MLILLVISLMYVNHRHIGNLGDFPKL